MNVHVSDFDTLVKQKWNYPGVGKDFRMTQMRLFSPDADVTGGKIRIKDIDQLAAHPEIQSVTVSGLHQDTFEYFIRTYGRQLRFIEFFKNKAVEDWSLLGTLPALEGVKWFHNQRITRLWDMRGNTALKAVVLEDFTRLHDLSGIEKAPALEWFGFGDAVWSTSEIESLKPFVGTGIKRIDFSGKKIRDMDLSFLPALESLEVFNFPSNHFTTEQVAWLAAKCPALKGESLKPCIEFVLEDPEGHGRDKPAVIIVGKRKPILTVEGHQERIAHYIEKFEKLVAQYSKE